MIAYDPDAEKIHQTGYMWKDNLCLLKALADSERYALMRLSCCVDSISPEDEKQFAALTIGIGDGTTLVAYRGTDDTLIGWKEDLNMVYACPVPAQREAVRYLERVSAAYPDPLRITGHSKGGNLAMFAASGCSDATARRIVSVISHDGPGLSEKTILSPGYGRIRNRLRVYIPHSSFIGMLLEHENSYTVVQSDAKSIHQHDAFSWQMRGTKMLYADAPSERSLQTSRILRDWIGTLDENLQQLFIEAIYEIASSAYGDTLPDDIETNWPASVQAIFFSIRKLDPATRSLFRKGLTDLFSTAIRHIHFPWQQEGKEESDDTAVNASRLANPEDG